MSAPTIKTLYTSSISIESINTDKRVLTITVINCSNKNITGTASIMDINGMPVFPVAAYNLAPGKYFSNGGVAFGANRPTVLAVYGVVTVNNGQANDIRASLGLWDNKGNSTISVEAR